MSSRSVSPNLLIKLVFFSINFFAIIFKDLETSLPGQSDENKNGENNFVLRLLTLNYQDNKNDIQSNNIIINLHGCLILQEILKFKKSDKVSEKILSLFCFY